LLGFALIVSAEETATATETTNNVIAEDLGTQSPNLLPGNPFYFLKEWSRSIQLALTFDAVKKAELQLKFAGEKIMEIKKIAENSSSTETMNKAVENYQKSMDKVKNYAEKIKEKVSQNEKIGKFLDKFVQHEALQNKILEKLQTQVSTTTFQKIEENRETHIEKFENVMQKLEDRTDKQIEILNDLKDKLKTATATILKIENMKENILKSAPSPTN